MNRRLFIGGGRGHRHARRVLCARCVTGYGRCEPVDRRPAVQARRLRRTVRVGASRRERAVPHAAEVRFETQSDRVVAGRSRSGGRVRRPFSDARPTTRRATRSRPLRRRRRVGHCLHGGDRGRPVRSDCDLRLGAAGGSRREAPSGSQRNRLHGEVRTKTSIVRRDPDSPSGVRGVGAGVPSDWSGAPDVSDSRRHENE